jgi:cation diffusion facilitator family transporter
MNDGAGAALAEPGRIDPRLRSMGFSLGVSVLMLSGKVTAFMMTGSSAILSDAAESIVHVFATALVALSLWYTLRPADYSHPYGHGKAAYFSAGFEGGMIIIAALAIIYAAVSSLIRGPNLEQLGAGLLIIAGLTLVNLVLGLYLIRSGRRNNSVVLVANGKHVLTDMWTSVGVVVGVLVVWLTGVVWLDPIVAIVVALNILGTGGALIRESFSGLMERIDPADTEVLLEELDRSRRNGEIVGFHQVRHRRIDDQRWIEYHLLFPDRVTLSDAHARSHIVEDRIRALFPNDITVVTAHLEPRAHEDAHPGGHSEPTDPLQSRLT